MIEAIKNIAGYESLTDQQIADALRATGVTQTAINRANLVHLLNLRGMLQKIVGNNSDEKWTGSVLAMQDAILAVGTDEQKHGIRLWFSHITNPSNLTWDTRDVAFAAPFWQIVQMFADQPGMPTTEDFAAIAGLGGGWRFADVTAEQVAAAKADEAARVSEAMRAETLRVRVGKINDAVAAIESTLSDPTATVDDVLAAFDTAFRTEWGG